MSSAQAAATAAFKANKAGTPPPTKTRRPSRVRLPTDNRRSSAILSPSFVKSPLRATPSSSHTNKSSGSDTPRVYGNTPRSSRPNEHHDYFSIPTRPADQDHSSANSRNKISTNTNPKDMLEQVRNSINSKSKVGTLQDIISKSQVSVNDFRHSVDQRRMKSQEASDQNSTVMLLDGLSPHHSSSSIVSHPSATNSESEVYQHFSSSKSHSSLGSTYSGLTEGDVPLPNITLTFSASTPEETPRRRSSTPKEKDPIPVPPSSNALARSLAANTDSMVNLSISPSHLGPVSSTDALVTDSSDGKLKPGRKPPPNVSSSPQSVRTGAFSPRPSHEYEPRTSESSEFPQYPDLPVKQHKNIFSKRRMSVKGVVYDPPSSAEDEADEADVRTAVHVGATPPNSANYVKLKTTMREKSRREQKKSQFNEDKPWKNHSDLDYISDQQRKRYEGIWASNKGAYLDHVATKLVGVHAKKDETEEVPKASRDYTEKEISERAAKFSSQVSKEASSLDVAHLHGLECVDIQDLIHGVVVKRLWSRSKLPHETLEAIWDLVDFRKDGTLSKAEFIAGMWLVDQCLYGRKLPKVVTQQVWASVGSLGVSMVVKKKRR